MPNNNNKTLEHMNTKLKAQHGEELYYPISIKAEKHNAKQREMIDSSSTSDCHYCNKDTNCDKVKTMFHACSAEAEKIHKIIERFELHERSSYFPKVYEDHLNEHNKKNSEFLSKFENKLEVMDRKVNNFYRMSRLVNSYIISLMYRILIGKEREPTNFKPNEEPIRADRVIFFKFYPCNFFRFFKNQSIRLTENKYGKFMNVFIAVWFQINKNDIFQGLYLLFLNKNRLVYIYSKKLPKYILINSFLY